MRRAAKEPLQRVLARAAVAGLDRRQRTIEEIRALEPERIVVSRTDRIGDLLVSSVMIAALRRRWPRARLVVIGGPRNRAALDGMPFAEPGPLFRRDPRSWAPLRRWLADQRFDLAMSLQAESVAGAMIAAWSRAPVRMITHSTKVSAAFNFVFGPEERHHVTRFCRAAEQLGAPCIEHRPVFEVPPASRERVRDIARGWRKGGRVVAIQIPNRTTSRHGSRAWPEERILGLAQELSDRGRRVVLFAFGVERPEAERLRAAVPPVEIAPPVPLLDAAALAAELDVFVSGYTGMYHVADAVGTKTVLIGSAHYAEYWRALGPKHRHALAETAPDVPLAAVVRDVEDLLA
jgi:ADP-heptose:LPS heptosyltransferase